MGLGEFMELLDAHWGLVVFWCVVLLAFVSLYNWRLVVMGRIVWKNKQIIEELSRDVESIKATRQVPPDTKDSLHVPGGMAASPSQGNLLETQQKTAS